ncbi:MAG: 2-oxo acid dehydrogenase subunit E2 [Desulfobacterales bacterium]|nr:MAG: 2-oxo acid dehydrogenase subunit E2 [Desulfobacterales bacterium]
MATEIVIPMLGITVEKGKILEWLKNEGDPVEKGESIFVVEADKVTTEVESPASGILAKILLPEGVEVPVLTVVGVITRPGEEVPAKYLAAPAAVAAAAPSGAEIAVSTPPAPETAPAARAGEGVIRIVPAARKLAQEKGLDLGALTGTGPEGVILFKDVQTAAAKAAEPAPKVSTLARRHAAREGVSLAAIQGTGVRGRVMRADVERVIREERAPRLGGVIAMDTMRQVIARRLSESAFSAPHVYFFTDVKMDPLLDFRKQILADFEARFGGNISINDFLIKAVALNIADFPILNATIRDKEIHIPADINISLAVALPDGLIVPAVARADHAGLAEIARQRTDLVKRARAGKLTMEEIERGTFTISSLAQYDITQFTAIINPPQSGILAVGKTREELYLLDGEVAGRQVATFGLAVDHRIIDGVVAAEFLQHLKLKLEKPAFTFLHL